jgi:hypothetical protein
VFRGLPHAPPFPGGGACLIGAHYLLMPPSGPGPALTCLLTGRSVVEHLAARFEEQWAGAHDVGVAVLDTIAALRAGARAE